MVCLVPDFFNKVGSNDWCWKHRAGWKGYSVGVDDEWLMQEERGWSDPRKWVCRRCVGNDTYLRRLVWVNRVVNACSYCSKQRQVTQLSTLMDALLQGVRYSYNDDANAGYPYDSKFAPEYFSSEDVLRNVLDSQDLEWSDALIRDVARSFINSHWVEAPDGEWMGSYHHERLHWSWNSFAHAVKHRSRFHFHIDRKVHRYDDDVVGVHEMLPFLGKLIRRHRMLKSLPADTILYRVRPGIYLHTVAELGAPPNACAKAGRMNPAGVPYLYLAFDEVTALKEMRVNHDQEITISQWRPERILNLIDLSRCPEIPSIFSNKKSKHELARFLHTFKDEISRPVAHDGSEHIEYVPTQVVSEYLAQEFNLGANKLADGVIYPSAVSKNGKNLVVFPNLHQTLKSKEKQPFAMIKLETARTGRVCLNNYSVIPQAPTTP